MLAINVTWNVCAWPTIVSLDQFIHDKTIYIFDLEKLKEKIAEIVPRVFILGIMIQKLIFRRKKLWNFILFSVQILCIASTVLFLFRIWDGDRYLVNLRYSMRMKYNTLCTAYSCTHWTTEQVLVVLASRMSTLNTFPE